MLQSLNPTDKESLKLTGLRFNGGPRCAHARTSLEVQQTQLKLIYPCEAKARRANGPSSEPHATCARGRQDSNRTRLS